MSETSKPNELNALDEIERNRPGAKASDGCMSTPIEQLRPDMDLSNPRCVMKIASERLSIVRYVFLVQIEDGIATAAQRASLEYADAVLIGWPEEGCRRHRRSGR